MIEGTDRVQEKWKQSDRLPFHIVAIVERDPERRATAQATYPKIPCFEDIEAALTVVAGPSTFVQDFTSPIGRRKLLAAARSAGVPVLLEKPLSSPGLEVSLAGLEREVSVSMSEVFNPVVRALAGRLADEASEIRSLAFVRVNAVSLQRLVDPHCRQDIIGGAFVDKLVHDVHLLLSGTLLGPVNIEFGLPQIDEIGFDLVEDRTARLRFTSLNGAPLPPSESATPDSASEMMVDLTMPMQLDGRSVPTRWIASWCGVPDDLAARLGIPNADVEAARVVSPGDPNAVGRAAYPRSNLKLIICDYTNRVGEEAQLIGNLQARGPVGAWLIERRNGAEYYLPVQYRVSVIESMGAFSKHFRTGGYLGLESIERADRTVLDIRSGFRKPLKEELDVERSLAILDRNHGGVGENGEGQCNFGYPTEEEAWISQKEEGPNLENNIEA